ncbi:uncharacterized protein LOC106653677 [Trichogramma pretiosum]|uniref:uncharacterized protein LOC106653677 n=1 Tax=Trichogramma pretiosum TaxID=7493 RepID=UPI0006C98082|nr:uncharacterized protein LOC106653677 [Trichogramma pretiosum]
MENFIQYKIFGASQLKLKPDVVPHNFACQPERANNSTDLNRTAFKKLNRKRLLSEILKENNQDSCNIKKPCSNEGSASKLPLSEFSLSEFSPSEHFQSEFSYSDCADSAQNETALFTVSNAESEKENNIPNTQSSFDPEQTTSCASKDLKEVRSIGVQTLKLTKYRSKGITCKPSVKDSNCQTLTETCDKSCLVNIVVEKAQSESASDNYTETSSEVVKTSDSEYKISTSNSENDKIEKNDAKVNVLSVTNYLISMDSKLYLGILPEWLWILNLLQQQTDLPLDHIKLTLQKIRLNDTFTRLGPAFSYSNCQAGRIFNKSVQKLAHLLKTLIYAPSQESVKKLLPIQFRANFSDVYLIIDAFEIQILKPTDPVHQSLTWSEYKKCNTLKYLVAVTCDGMIAYISQGYGGRISDVLLFEKCGITQILPEGCGILADRGFKQIDNILNQFNCKLIRPPSVSSTVKPSKSEVLLTKRIASIRIHVERVIRRIREYKLLEPHASLDLDIMPNIDCAVTIACALINLQKPVIRT